MNGSNGDSASSQTQSRPPPAADPVGVSAALLRTVREGRDTQPYFDWLAARRLAELGKRLDCDAARLAFWINCYNATTQQRLRADPDRYENRRAFFRAELLSVAGRSLSLNDIEHGILRRGYPKWTFGYVRWPFRDELESRLEPETRDPRIHFALNCGAESCPVIRPYTRENIDTALEEATRMYLESSVRYDPEAGTCRVPRVFLWFRGDFGGKSGILAFLRQYDQLPVDARPRLRHREWDWSLDLEAFA